MGQLSDTEELADELYLVPPAGFVAARDELVRQARTAGNRELARELGRLRRPTQSAWLVNMLARHERPTMDRLFALGRDLRRAQTRLDGPQLQQLSADRHALIADLIARARGRADGAGVRTPASVLAEVEETLRAGLVDLAAAATVASGRLVKPLSHSGFGPMPHLEVPSLPTPEAAPPGERGGDDGHEWSFWPVEAPDTPDTAAGPSQVARLRSARDTAAERPIAPPRAIGEAVRRAEAGLAAAQASLAERQTELGDAEAGVTAARERLAWLERQRTEAHREQAEAAARLADAKAARRAAADDVARARRALDDASGAR